MVSGMCGFKSQGRQTQGKPDLGTAIIQLDFMYTYTGPEGCMEEPTQGRVQERQDQYGTCLIMASTERKAIHVVPVPSKGAASLKQVAEEVIRFFT